MPVWHTKFADVLPIVVMVQTHRKTQAGAHVVLCSRDLAISYAHLIDYDRWRFQLECNFRDAKHYGGLEDCMTVQQPPVDHSAHLAMFMVHVSHAVMRPMRTPWPACSVHDLQAWFRSRK